ncbi:MAG TPA: hypothetical protein VII52_11735 [Gemmatimonadaceae bacterium]
MNVNRLIRRSLPLAGLALVVAAPVAFSQGQQIFEWSGRVDREVQITMRGNDVTTRQVGNTETGRYRQRSFMQIPRQNGQVVVRTQNGRGNVDVIEQPSPRNGFTTTIRIQDPASGAADYRVSAYWQPLNGDAYRGNGIADRGRDDRDRAGGINGRNGARTMMRWTGNVDGELEIRIQNGRVDYRNLSGKQPTNIRSSGSLASNRSNGQVFIAQNQGRGSVALVQQPSPYNGYTTVIRVRDPQGGYGYYDFNVMQ